MDILDMIKEAGVVGAGGAGFPTHAKLSGDAEYILLNGAECEPLIRVDQQLMEVFPDEILKGLESAGRLVHAKKALLGVKKKHKNLILVLRQRLLALGFDEFMEVVELKDVYPAGDEQVLVYELTGRVVPEAGLPIHVGCVVVNSETALNIYKATRGEAVTETYVTVSGDVPNPVTVKVPVGMPVLDVIKLSGVDDLSACGVIDGGPMMGFAQSGGEGYVTKKSKAFIVLKKEHPLMRRKSISPEQARRVNRAACEQCRMCTDMCPRYLLGHSIQPHKTMRAISFSVDDLEGNKAALLCSQCALCELFSCPAGLYPRAANVYFKDRLAQQHVQYVRNQDKFEPRGAREYRMLPTKRLIMRLGLKKFDKPAPITEIGAEPAQVCISTKQHLGAPASPVVSPGERVLAGQKIGEVPKGSLGAAIHASITGVVAEVSGECITIRRD